MKAKTRNIIKSPFPLLQVTGEPAYPALMLEQAARDSAEREVMAEVIRSTALLSPTQGSASISEMVAGIARRVLKARFVLVARLEQQQWRFSSAGDAPRLLASLQEGVSFFEEAIQAGYAFRQKDPASDPRTAFMNPDIPALRSMLACPVRIKGAPAGLLLAFGKTGAFTEFDASLAELLVLQAASLLESSQLYQDLQSNLRTTQILYDLTLDIAQAEDLQAAVQVIARTAHRLFQPEACGLLLFAPDGNKEAEVSLPARAEHPYALAHQVMADRQLVYMAQDDDRSMVCVPVQTSRRCYGVLWLLLKENSFSYQVPEKIMHLMNQAVVALERSILLAETQLKSQAIQSSYREQEEAHQNFMEALMKLLEARDGETREHSARVRLLSKMLGAEMGLNKAQITALDRGALLHDIGKIKIRDEVLLKKGPLDGEEWRHMRTHPTVGSSVVQLLPAWRDALPVIAYHHERWDGSGYPLGLVGSDIPLLARIFAVVDVFDALTSDRPYRARLKPVEALEYLESQAGIHFDPAIVEKMARIIRALMAEEENGRRLLEEG